MNAKTALKKKSKIQDVTIVRQYPKMSVGVKPLFNIPSIVITDCKKPNDPIYIDDANGKNAKVAALFAKSPLLLAKAVWLLEKLAEENREDLRLDTLSAIGQLSNVVSSIKSTEAVILKLM